MLLRLNADFLQMIPVELPRSSHTTLLKLSLLSVFGLCKLSQPHARVHVLSFGHLGISGHFHMESSHISLCYGLC